MDITPNTLYPIFRRHPVICTDTRQITPGCLFFALKGERFDANDFAADALAKGAACAVVDNPAWKDSPHPQLLWVPDVLDTLQQLAALHRRSLSIPVIALTGTNGKTTTKELIYAVLSTTYRVTATQGNLNNHIGVPLSLLHLDDQTQIGLIEMGASHPEEIAQLVDLVQPTLGLITNVGKAHLEGFGSIEGVMACKGALYQHLVTHGGHIFYNTEEPLLYKMLQDAGVTPEDSNYPLTPYGISCQSVNCTRDRSQGALQVQIAGYPPIQTHLIGQYNLHNILAALAVGRHFGVDPARAAAAIAAYQPTNNRSQWIQTDRNTLVVDAYNANPTSMAASLDSFEQLPADNPKCFILGDMRELGTTSESEHARVVERVNSFVQQHPNSQVFWVGENFTRAAQEAGGRQQACTPQHTLPAHCFPNVDSLMEHLKQTPLSGYTLLIKGSNSLHLTRLKEIL